MATHNNDGHHLDEELHILDTVESLVLVIIIHAKKKRKEIALGLVNLALLAHRSAACMKNHPSAHTECCTEYMVAELSPSRAASRLFPSLHARYL